MAEPTQMLILSIPASKPIEDPTSPAGTTWQEILELIRKSKGYKRLYWGRHVEKPDHVQLHIVRSLLSHHHTFLTSSSPHLTTLLHPLVTNTKPTIHHALISEYSKPCKGLGNGAPVTGTAIYLSTTTTWNLAWTAWVSFVQSVPGFLGIAGGPVLEAIKGEERAFVALVGWESVAMHEAYHHTRHFREQGRRVLLDEAEGGYAHYGHIAFAHQEVRGENGDEGGGAKL
ncbi:hypothetical protein BGZ57DRAFT_930193 [Hyaloscypha finlandica]|nr:hypothetical protein BGZ57DRAFT_930193 [Hyaloscypha finlandica]